MNSANGRIRLLPDSVKKKIAAGEVVEGPFSVVKELMENSLDAGATRIEVAVEEAGLRRIEVADDGGGISPEDLPLAVMEHATSKIADIEDIERVLTLGFRGEALSSIAAVSRCTILSRRSADDLGGRLECDGGEPRVSSWAGPAGTTVVVENLFYNVPARKKFLKSPRGEMTALRAAFVRLAAAHPERYFSLAVDDGKKLVLPPAKGTRERLAQIYGEAAAGPLIEESISDIKVTLRGFFSPPGEMRAARNMQLFYINSRPVEYRYLGHLVSRAYESAAPPGRHPAVIVFMEIEPGLLDVNVHPAKREVRLFDQRYADGLVVSLARKAIGGEMPVPAGLFREAGPAVPSQGEKGGYAGDAPAPSLSFGDSPTGRTYLFSREMPPTDSGAGAPSSDTVVLGVAFGAYIVYERGEALYFMDFHAAHERLLYDALISGHEAAESQSLAFPALERLSVEEHALVLENISTLAEFGFDIDDFGDHVINIRAVPAGIGDAHAGALMREVIEGLAGGPRDMSRRERLAASIACHGARRAGDRLLPGEAERLVDAFAGRERETRCPHGRPFVYRMDRQEIERMFRRK